MKTESYIPLEEGSPVDLDLVYEQMFRHNQEDVSNRLRLHGSEHNRGLIEEMAVGDTSCYRKQKKGERKTTKGYPLSTFRMVKSRFFERKQRNEEAHQQSVTGI